MSAGIRIADSGESLASAAFGRPQVQSRRVSLRLGPLDLTYSTDELLLDPTTGRSTAASAAGEAGETSATQTAAQASAQTAAASDASWVEAEPEDFPQELATARRVEEAFAQAARAAAETRTYRPSAKARAASGATASAAAATAQEETNATSAAGATSDSGATRLTTSAMRRAIAAYLSCGAQGAAAGSLDAVA